MKLLVGLIHSLTYSPEDRYLVCVCCSNPRSVSVCTSRGFKGPNLFCPNGTICFFLSPTVIPEGKEGKKGGREKGDGLENTEQ